MLIILLSNSGIILIFALCQRYCCTYKVLSQEWLCVAGLKNLLIKILKKGKIYTVFHSSLIAFMHEKFQLEYHFRKKRSQTMNKTCQTVDDGKYMSRTKIFVA